MHSTKWNCYASFISPTLLRRLPNGWCHSQTYTVFFWAGTTKLPESTSCNMSQRLFLTAVARGYQQVPSLWQLVPLWTTTIWPCSRSTAVLTTKVLCVVCIEMYMLSDCNPIHFMAYWGSKGRSPEYYCHCFFPLSFPGTSGCYLGWSF